MKQQMFIQVDTEIDHDKTFYTQQAYENYISEAIKAAVKEFLKTPLKDTSVDFDYGDTV